jgi:hypothetical protein
LFIGVAVAPGINASVVKTSSDNDFVEVATQAFGINGYEDTTVKLTREQYNDLEQYLVEFRARLNQTTTKEETFPVFNDAIAVLASYGLLPNKMTVTQDPKIITGENQHIFERIDWQKIQKKTYSGSQDLTNMFCLISGTTTNTFFQPLSSALLYASYTPLNLIFVIFMILLLQGILPIISAVITFLLEMIGSLMGKSLDYMFTRQPLLFGANMWLARSSGWIHTIGLNGLKNTEGISYGTIPNGLFYDMAKSWIFGYTEPNEPGLAVAGFVGIRLQLSNTDYKSFYLGSALVVKINSLFSF